MDQNELQKNIALYYSKLPVEAQEIFSKMEWLEALRKIAIKYGLNDAQQQTLATETTLAFLGMISLLEYESILVKELGLSKSSTDEMIIEIDTTIFKAIKPSLQKAYEANVESEKEEGENITPVYDERIEKLPEEVERAVHESNYQSALYNISREHSLNIEQLGMLESATTDLIIGKIHPDDFTDLVQTGLNLPSTLAAELVNEMNEKIFKKIIQKVISSGKIEIGETPNKTEPVSQQPTKVETPTPPAPPNPIPEVARPEITGPPASAMPEALRAGSVIPPLPPSSILEKKLTQTVQSPPKTTEHYSGSASNQNPNATSAKKYSLDPYREPPE